MGNILDRVYNNKRQACGRGGTRERRLSQFKREKKKSPILFVSPYSLFDSTNGASISMRTLLETLVGHGFQCYALTGSFSPAPGDILGLGRTQDLQVELHRHGFGTVTRENIRGFDTIRFVHRGVRIEMLAMSQELATHLYCQEVAVHSLLEELIQELKPWLVLASTRVSVLDRIVRLAERHGIPTSVYLATAKSLTEAEILRRCERVLVPSEFLARYYGDRYGADCTLLRPIVSFRNEVLSRRGARFVTMVNPSPEKGLTLFWALARRALTAFPWTRFMAVEGRWTRSELAQSSVNLAELPNVVLAPNETEMERIFARTSILLFPAFWEEAFGRTIVEAQLHGIPVIASRRGGIPEALNGAGILVDLPERFATDYNAIPTEKEIGPWLEHLGTLLADRRTRRQESRAAHHAAETLVRNSVGEAVSLFSSML
jgi:glycosyltransferase involved in cell wall biosynthesis